MPLYFNMEEAFSLDVKILWNKIYCIALCNDRVHKSQYVLFLQSLESLLSTIQDNVDATGL